MIKKLLSILLLLVSSFAFAQQKDTIQPLPPYLQVPIVPPFKIQKTDSVFYTKDSLPSKRPIVIMYFSPDCGHCQKQIKELTDSMQFVSKAFFVLAAFKQMPEIAAFEKKYKLKKFDNIRIGRDLKYFIPGFYKVKFTPFTAVYDKHGKFLKAYEFGFTIKEISELLE